MVPDRSAAKGVERCRIHLCVDVFGVLLAADEDMPSAHVKQAVAILAEMMDQDMDGMVDDPKVASAGSS